VNNVVFQDEHYEKYTTEQMEKPSSNHTVIVLDSRGVGNTTIGSRPFSVQQFVNDTAGLMDALKINDADVLGYSLKSFIAQQYSGTFSEKVNRLVFD
jgi:pimeloyl-ACP methyl ester carboxylesterase